jgi:lysophospholipase L1-like esterase
MPRFRAKLFLFFLCVLMVPVLLLLAEAGVRLFGRHLDPLEVFVASPQLRSDTQGENTSGLFEFDPLLTWRLKANLRNVWWDFTPVSTNAAHLRLDREVGAKHGLRMVCLGDSVTFGYRVPVAANREQPQSFDASEKAYPGRLEELLRAKNPGQEIEVLPLACPGYTSGQGLAWLRRDIERLQPDIVTACFGWNDARAAGLPDRMTMPQGPQVSVRGFIAHSQLLLHVTQMAQRKGGVTEAPAPEPRSSEAEYVENIVAMDALCRERGAKFVIILPVYRDPNTAGDYPEGAGYPGNPEEGKRIGAYRQALGAEAKKRGLSVLEIPELTEAGWPANAGYFGERIHPNARGHELMAERLAEVVMPLIVSGKK